MDTLSAILAVALFVAFIVGAIRLGEHWQLVEAQKKNAEAWGYLRWDEDKLVELHNEIR